MRKPAARSFLPGASVISVLDGKDFKNCASGFKRFKIRECFLHRPPIHATLDLLDLFDGIQSGLLQQENQAAQPTARPELPAHSAAARFSDFHPDRRRGFFTVRAPPPALG